ncbi:MAG: bifunctional uridylyltransferase/uridylyl-removing protein, partial [Alphaproteobacteria bacterium]|nr:bifunctional uridylyltransferase/uridylyl-removing protein [Alphaproteobacteria bacterium]
GVWNGWKGQLLRELYYEAEALMSGGDASPARASRVRDAKSALAERIADLPQAAREHALTRHYDAYWLAFDADAHERHARMMETADAKGELLALATESNAFRAITDVVIYTPDHPGLFSQIAGAIAVSGGSIADAKAFTTTDGFALDVFSIQDADGTAFDDAPRITRLRDTITKTLSGRLYPRKSLAKRAQGGGRITAFRVSPRVNFDNDASATATVIEVEGRDRPGLLYDITRAIFDSGLSISSSIVATYGERAIDTFYVRDGFGHKISHPERLASVEKRILSALEAEALAA